MHIIIISNMIIIYTYSEYFIKMQTRGYEFKHKILKYITKLILRS